MANTLAYYDMSKIMAVKSFMVQAVWSCRHVSSWMENQALLLAPRQTSHQTHPEQPQLQSEHLLEC